MYGSGSIVFCFFSICIWSHYKGLAGVPGVSDLPSPGIDSSNLIEFTFSHTCLWKAISGLNSEGLLYHAPDYYILKYELPVRLVLLLVVRELVNVWRDGLRKARRGMILRRGTVVCVTSLCIVINEILVYWLASLMQQKFLLENDCLLDNTWSICLFSSSVFSNPRPESLVSLQLFCRCVSLHFLHLSYFLRRKHYPQSSM